MHREDGSIIYIGKSRNIKKRLNQHFTSDNRKSKKIQLEVAAVSYEATGSDLIAQLKESEEIKRNKPRYNRALRKTIYNYQLGLTKDEAGYLQFKIEKTNLDKPAITTFTNYQQAKSQLFKITEQHQLCQKHTGLHKTSGPCFLHTIKECFGACIGEEPVDQYNARVERYLAMHSYENQNMVIIDHGREVDERSVILIEDGVYRGFGFFNLNYQINNLEILRSIISPMEDNRDAQHIIHSFLRRKKVLKIIPLEKLHNGSNFN